MPKSGSLGHSVALDGLRGLAVALVLIYHGGVSWLPGGFLGVSVFFTLSGFLIASLLLREWHRTNSIALRSFWGRRVRRLLPASLVGIALAAAYIVWAAPLSAQQRFRGDGLAALADVANWRMLVDGQSYAQLFAAPSPLQHFWSLAVEEQVYLLLPLALLVVLRVTGHARRSVGIAAAVLLTASVALPHVIAMSDDRFYYGTDTRGAEILVGVLLAVLIARRRGDERSPFIRRNPALVAAAGAIALVGVVAACVLTRQGDRWLYEGGLALFAVLPALVIVAALDERGPVARVLAVRPLAALGRVSFAVYVYHWPIMLWLAPPADQSWSPGRLALAWGLTVAAAVVSSRLIEQPWRRRQGMGLVPVHRVAPMAVAIVAVVVLAVTVSVPEGNHSFDLAAGSLVSDLGAGVPAPDRRPVGPAVRSGPVGPGDREVSVVPPPVHRPDRPLRLLMVGDSTAVALNGTIETWGTAEGLWHSLSFARIGCGIGRGGQVRVRPTEIQPSDVQPLGEFCGRWAEEWSTALAIFEPDVVVVSASIWDAADRKLAGDDMWRSLGDPRYDDFLRHEYGQAMDVLAATGATVVWIDNPPLQAGATAIATLPGVSEPDRIPELNEIVAELATQRPSVRVVPVTRYLESRPAGVFDPAMRPDGLHLNGPASSELGAWLGPTILDAFWRTRPGSG